MSSNTTAWCGGNATTAAPDAKAPADGSAVAGAGKAPAQVQEATQTAAVAAAAAAVAERSARLAAARLARLKRLAPLVLDTTVLDVVVGPGWQCVWEGRDVRQ